MISLNSEDIRSQYISRENYTYKSNLLFEEALNAADFVEYVENLIPRKFKEKYGLGAIHQLGLAVPDVEDAVPELEARGVGPMMVGVNNAKFWYECGENKMVRLKSATGYSLRSNRWARPREVIYTKIVLIHTPGQYYIMWHFQSRRWMPGLRDSLQTATR